MFSKVVRAALSTVLSVVCLASVGEAQAFGPGLVWEGSSGTFAGGFFPGCTPDKVTFMPSEIVTITVSGDIQAPFWLATAPSATSCVSLPGINGGLALDAPISIVATGLLTEISPCLSCPPGFRSFTVVIPGSVPPGTTISLQALSLGGGSFGLSVPITAASA